MDVRKSSKKLAAEVVEACANVSCTVVGDHVKYKCSQCKAVCYCSKECQQEHWRTDGGNHKSHCKPAPVAAADMAAEIIRLHKEGMGKKRIARALNGATCKMVHAVLAAHTPEAAAAAPTATLLPEHRRLPGPATDGRAGHTVVDPVHPCPLCLCREDLDGCLDENGPRGAGCGICLFCGQMFCGICKLAMIQTATETGCPICREPSPRSPEDEFKTAWNTLHTERSKGRWTPEIQYCLGGFYMMGYGTNMDWGEAEKCKDGLSLFASRRTSIDIHIDTMFHMDQFHVAVSSGCVCASTHMHGAKRTFWNFFCCQISSANNPYCGQTMLNAPEHAVFAAIGDTMFVRRPWTVVGLFADWDDYLRNLCLAKIYLRGPYCPISRASQGFAAPLTSRTTSAQSHP